MDKPKIDKGITIPKSRRVSKYEWISELKVGDSFVIDESKRFGPERIAKQNGMILRCTTAGQEQGKLRIWRIK